MGEQELPSRSVLVRRRNLLGAGAGLLAMPALAQGAWPTRPIRLVIPFGAGGSVDVAGRLLADKLGAIFGQPGSR